MNSQDQPLELTMPQEPKESRLVLVGIVVAIAFVAGFLMGARA